MIGQSKRLLVKRRLGGKNLSLVAPCPPSLQAGEASKAVETYDMACQAADAANDIDMEEVALLYTKRGHSTST